MSHCLSVGVSIGDKAVEICTLVPGNEDLSRRVHDAEKQGGASPTPSKDEVQRAIDYHLGRHSEKDHPTPEPQTFIHQLRRLKE